MDQIHIYIMFVLLTISVTIGSWAWYLGDKYEWLYNVVRYITYILTVQGSGALSVMCYDMLHKRLSTERFKTVNWLQILFITCGVILISNGQQPYTEHFPLFFIAYLIVEYSDIMDNSESPIKYGVGMACNFYEGYLKNVIPSNGQSFGGIVQNIQAFESREGIAVPVKKLFVILTKSLYSPPDLQEFNKLNRDDLPKLEACSVRIAELSKPLDDVEKDIAGVKSRSYKNSAYRIYRARGPPVSLVAECATPLRTLQRVRENSELYGDLADVDADEVCRDFYITLNNILSRMPDCRDRVELVIFDDTDPQLNLADVLLDRIRQLEPNFEKIISARRSNLDYYSSLSL